MKLGFIGLGQMGVGMAANLIAKGHEVSVWNRSPHKAAPLIAAGARLASSPADAAQGDIVMTMLADDAAVEAIVHGDDGILGQPAVHVSHSTISVACADRLAHAHGPDAFVSAPVFGRPAAAQAGQLFVAVAGADTTVDRVTPALNAIGSLVFRVGATPSQANLVKLGGNFMLVAMVEAFAEAMTLAEAGGIARRTFFDIMTNTLFNTPAARVYGELLVTEAYRPAGFPAAFGLKDMNLVDDVADANRVPMPILGILRDHLRAVVGLPGAEQDGGLDLAAIGLRARRPVQLFL